MIKEKQECLLINARYQYKILFIKESNTNTNTKIINN
jgi:hypothetical protein